MRVADVVNLGGYEAFLISDRSRAELAKRFPPKYPEFIGHHVTYKFGVKMDPTADYGREVDVRVIGYAEEDGLEVLVVSVDGEVQRHDGSFYHITWSLDRSKGKKPAHSNALVKRGFTKVEEIPLVESLFQFIAT